METTSECVTVPRTNPPDSPPHPPSSSYTVCVLQVGFGKGTASKTIWLDGIDPSMPESQLERHMSKFGEVSTAMLSVTL